MSAQMQTQAKPQSKLELAETKLLKIKENTKLMLESKKAAQLKMEELKQQIAEQSKAMKEEIKQADQQLLANKTALKSVQANIKRIKQSGESAPVKVSKRAMAKDFVARVVVRVAGQRVATRLSLKPRPKSKLELATAKLSKIKVNTKLMLDNKKNAALKMDELKHEIACQSKATREEIKKADQKLKANQTALKSVQATIKKLKEAAAAMIKEEAVASFSSFYSQAMKA